MFGYYNKEQKLTRTGTIYYMGRLIRNDSKKCPKE